MSGGLAVDNHRFVTIDENDTVIFVGANYFLETRRRFSDAGSYVTGGGRWCITTIRRDQFTFLDNASQERAELLLQLVKPKYFNSSAWRVSPFIPATRRWRTSWAW